MVTSRPIIGLMSGTSLDGLDMVCVEFTADGQRLSHRVLAAETWPYDNTRQAQLREAHLLSGLDLALLDISLGQTFGTITRDFCERHHLDPAYIGSHGHTIFHQPAHGLTLQIGSPFHLAVACGKPVVAQFRNMDVAIGGQGAPLVPIADRLLYGDYTACLNLGGIANISWRQEHQSTAFDICVCNMALNALAQRKGKNYDEGGQWAASGRVDAVLLETLIAHPYHSTRGPKSLGKEFFEQHIEGVLNEALRRISLEDVLSTMTEYIAQAIAHELRQRPTGSCYITGGGALNTYLIQRIQAHSDWKMVVGTSEDIHFKEAIAFALLAYLRMENRINVLHSVTGARCDHSAGIVYAAPDIQPSQQ